MTKHFPLRRAALVTALVSLYELPTADDNDDDGFIDVETPAGYQNAYSRLMVCNPLFPYNIANAPLGVFSSISLFSFSSAWLCARYRCCVDPCGIEQIAGSR